MSDSGDLGQAVFGSKGLWGMVSGAASGIAEGAKNLVSESIGELTGRNLQRKALMEQRDQIQLAKEEQQKMISDERERKRQSDISASSMAASIRRRAINRARSSLGSNESSILGSY